MGNREALIRNFYVFILFVFLFVQPAVAQSDVNIDDEILNSAENSISQVSEDDGVVLAQDDDEGEVESFNINGIQLNAYGRGNNEDSDVEAVDPFTGALSITHTDFVVPGPNGFDIVVARTYSSSRVFRSDRAFNGSGRPTDHREKTQVGLGWEMNFGRVRRTSGDDCSVVSASNTGDSPVLETAAGAQKILFSNTSLPSRSTATYTTKDFWSAYCVNGGADFHLIDPSGVQYWMTEKRTSTSAVSGKTSYLWLVTKIKDRNDNEMNFTYGAFSGDKVRLNKITTNDAREISFSYTSGLLTSISFNGETRASYVYNATSTTNNQSLLEDVIYPENRKRQYSYASSTKLLSKYENPRGGFYTYTYGSECKAYKRCGAVTVGIQRTIIVANYVVKTKKKYDADNSLIGTWSYTHAHSSNGIDQVTESFPGGRYVYRYHSNYRSDYNANDFNNFNDFWLVGLLKSKATYTGSTLTQTEAYEYANVKISTQNNTRRIPNFYGYTELDVYTDRLVKKTITRDGTNYVTDSSNFSNGRHPHTIAETGQASRTTTISYDDISPFGSKLAYAKQNESLSADANRKITRSFDADGNLTSKTEYGVTSTFTYFANGNLSTTNDALSNQIEYKDYYRGIPREEIYPESIVIERTVSPTGRVLTEKNGNGFTTTYSYDDYDRVSNIRPPLGRDLKIKWVTGNAFFDQQQFLRANSVIQKITYDGFGREICNQQDGIYTGKTYDAFDRLASETYPNYSSCNTAQRTNYTYDALGRLLNVNHVDGSNQQIVYQSGNKVKVTDEIGAINNYTYHSYGDPDERLLMGISGPESLQMDISRNELGQVTQIQQGQRISSFNYGASFFVQSETTPESRSTYFSRDAIGNITSKSYLGLGVSDYLGYTYDELNRLKTVKTINGVTAPTVTYTYDKNNNVKTMKSGVTDFRYDYNANDNLIREDQRIDNVLYRIDYSYSAFGHLTRIDYPGSKYVSYDPNALGWPTKALPYISSISYHPNGRPSEIIYGNGRKSTFTVNNRQWPIRSLTDGDISDIEITSYDGAGNAKSIIDNLTPNNDISLTYDGLHRLKTANGPWGSGSISYSSSGNIQNKTMGNTQLGYSYPSNKDYNLSRVTGVPGHFGAVDITYDSLGNIASKLSSVRGWRYTYDTASNLRTVKTKSGTVVRTYKYAGNSLKASMISPTERRRYLYNYEGKLLADVKVTGDRPTVNNIYIGNTLIGEVELNVPTPNPTINAASTQIYGYGYGDSLHKDQVKAYFDLSSGNYDAQVCRQRLRH